MNRDRIAIDVQEVVKTYEEGRIRALSGATLQVREGEFVAITGPSGCGKSTLLHLIAALDRPDSGRIVVDGMDLAEVRDLSTYRSHRVGLVFQLHNLLPTLSASANVQIPMYEAELSLWERRAKAQRLLEAVGLGDRANTPPIKLSGGERQRVAIARALANDPPILLADEPTGNLDSKAGEMVLDLLRTIQQKRGVTLVLVSHDAQIASAAERVVRMLDGRVVDEGLSGHPAG
ncbi:MAG: ABC transporter ATP-binding protein [Dehalococcoidia bacterium SM23_28_2]|nr:MAG: ABC transporter ATP-binding protein [Dehalococcoidia bacterium SM23_28_2]